MKYNSLDKTAQGVECRKYNTTETFALVCSTIDEDLGADHIAKGQEHLH